MKAKSATGEFDFETAADARPASVPGIPDDAEKLNWLRLIRTPHIGPTTFWDLITHFGTADAALDALPTFIRSGRISVSSIPSEKIVRNELAAAQSAGMRLVALGEPDYPPLLGHTEYPPPLLYIKGISGLWLKPPIAIVGSRVASAAGLKFAGQLASSLAEDGFAVVSGLARGIDGAAHRGALPHGTAAMLPGGLDNVYPPEHAKLADDILKTGVLISECVPGFQARAQDFPRRNRLISGSALGVVVVEAAEKSGSLITARLAGEQNREVFAVPGHPFDPRAAGTNGLLKDGAILTTCANDVKDALAMNLKAYRNENDTPISTNLMQAASTASLQEPQTGQPFTPFDGELLDAAKNDILTLLSFAPIGIDDLTRTSSREQREVNAALLLLDLEGRLERHGRGLISLKK